MKNNIKKKYKKTTHLFIIIMWIYKKVKVKCEWRFSSSTSLGSDGRAACPGPQWRHRKLCLIKY